MSRVLNGNVQRAGLAGLPDRGLAVGDRPTLAGAATGSACGKARRCSPAGTLVLGYALDRIVRSAVRRAELTGHRKADAISAGWIEAWRMLSRPDVRDQPRPWGIVTAAVRREITTDQVGAAYRTESRRAWRMGRHWTGREGSTAQERAAMAPKP